MEVKEEELNLFAGDKDNYYLKTWKNIEESGKIITNWIIKMLEILYGSVLMHFIITSEQVS